jgi:hypothetical protein
MATLSARGLMGEGDVYRARSIIGSEFICRIARVTTIGLQPAIVPIISGRAWITGFSQYVLDYADPWPLGYRLSDTWPRMGQASERLTRLDCREDAHSATRRRAPLETAFEHKGAPVIERSAAEEKQCGYDASEK